jgi:hypothetical protein
LESLTQVVVVRVMITKPVTQPMVAAVVLATVQKLETAALVQQTVALAAVAAETTTALAVTVEVVS